MSLLLFSFFSILFHKIKKIHIYKKLKKNKSSFFLVIIIIIKNILHKSIITKKSSE